VTAAGLDASFAAYLTLTAILAITPGGTTALVVRNTLGGGRGAGLSTAMGAAAANCTHALLAGIGVSVLLAHSPSALAVIRVAGAAYLAWLGLRSLSDALRPSGDVAVLKPAPTPSAGSGGFREGLTVNLANVTVITFYLTIVPSFVPPGASHWYFALLAACHVTIQLACHSIWSTALHAVRRWLAHSRARRALSAATGIALLFLAARVLF
jgi:threonine/homoserine/homoserine lactone efflux protein